MTAVGLVALLALSACGGETEATTTTNAPTTTSTTTAITIPATTTTFTGESDVHAEITWFLTVMNGAELTELQYEDRFSESFRQQVPFTEGFEPVLDQFRTGGPYAVVERTGTGSQGEAVIESSDGTRVRVLAELDDQGRFAGLLLQPEVPTLDDPPESRTSSGELISLPKTIGPAKSRIRVQQISVLSWL
jgi:hypothetical protein